MLVAGTGLSRLPEPLGAAREAATKAAARCGTTVRLVLVFASHHHSGRMGALVEAARGAAGAERALGCSAFGILTDEAELEEDAGVAVLALGGDALRLDAFHLDAAAGEGRELGAKLGAGLAHDPSAARVAVLLASSTAGWPEDLLAGFCEALGAGLPVVGAGLSGPLRDPVPTATVVDRQPKEGSTLGLVVSGWVAAAADCSLGLGAVGRIHGITKVRGDRIFELDGRPALEVVRDELPAGLREAVEARRTLCFAAVPAADAPGDRLERGRFAVKSSLSIQAKEGALVAPAGLAAGTRIGILVADPEAAGKDLDATLERLALTPAGRRPAFGLYFDCCGRGRDLYGRPDADVARIRARFPGLPVAGVFGSYEIAPVGGANRLLAYSGVLLLVAAGS